jgi:hypothetical protein
MNLTKKKKKKRKQETNERTIVKVPSLSQPSGMARLVVTIVISEHSSFHWLTMRLKVPNNGESHKKKKQKKTEKKKKADEESERVLQLNYITFTRFKVR